MLDVWADFDVVEVLLVNGWCDTDAPAVPSHFVGRVFLMNILCQFVDIRGFGISTHEGDARDAAVVLADELVQHVGGQRLADVAPKIWAVASWATAGTT